MPTSWASPASGLARLDITTATEGWSDEQRRYDPAAGLMYRFDGAIGSWHSSRVPAAGGGTDDVPGSAGRRPPPGRHALDLDLERKTQNRANEHDEPENGHILQGRRNGYRPDKVCGNQDFQGQQDCTTE